MVTYFNQHKLVVITKYKVFIFCWVYNMLTLMLKMHGPLLVYVVLEAFTMLSVKCSSP